MDPLKKHVLKLIKRCRKSQIAYTSAAKFCESAYLLGLFKAYSLERKEYQKVLSVLLSQMGHPIYRSRKTHLPFYTFKINFLNWHNPKNELGMLNKCLRADRCLCAAYEELLDGAEATHDLIENLRQQYHEVRKAIQELMVAKETTRH